MRIGPTTLHNFGPYEHVEFDLSKPGLTGIEGLMHDRPGCESNGSGKSYLFGGISWVLFDDPMRERYGKDDLIRLLFQPIGSGELEVVRDSRGRPAKPVGGCWGCVHVVGGAHDVRVERYRGHPEQGNRVRLFIDGVDRTRGRDAMTNEAIIVALGMDYRAFVSSIAFGARAEVKGFFAATDRERKEILDKLLGMEVYGQAQKIARARLRVVAEELEQAEAARATVLARIEDQTRIQQEMAGPEELEEMSQQAVRLRARSTLAVIQATRAVAVVEELRRILRTQDELVQKQQATYQASIDKAESRRRRIETERREAEREVSEHRTLAKAAAKEMARWDELSGSTCPTCSQKVARATSLPLRKAALTRRERAQRSQSESEKKIQELEARAEAVARPDPPKVLVRLEQRRDEVKEELRDQQKVVADWRAKIAEARAARKAADTALRRAQAQNEKLEGQIQQLRTELLQVESGLEVSNALADRLEFWAEGFGTGGLRSFLIEAEVPEINRVATRYAQRLLGSGARVQLTATRQLASGDSREELTVGAEIPGCTLSYAGASKGQKRRLDLALLLAFREIVGRRSAKSFDQLFADELFDGLDAAGEDAVVELLREISAECPVALITHSDVLKSAADRMLVVHHRDGVAELEEVG